jgi:glycosyltransferase involved in cell wall biosynthesis
MPKKTIWLINQYASTPETGIGGRHYYLAKEMAKQGHSVYLVAASYTHILRTLPVLDDVCKIEWVDGIHFIWIKVPKYDTAHSKQRVLNWFIFAWKLLFIPKFINNKPHAILFSSPAPFGFLASRWLARKFSARLVFEVRDIWPLTLVELGGYSRQHPFVWVMQRVEDYAYRMADKVLSNLPNAVEHMVGRGMDKAKFVWIPNGFSSDELSAQQPLAEEVLAQLPQNKFIIGYAGTIGLANALETLILAAENLKNIDGLAFVVVGQGKEKSLLQQQVATLKLANVTFIDPIPKSQMQALLKQFDVCYIGWRKDKLYKFGVAANKLFDYLLAGKPIVHAYSGAFDIVQQYHAGVSVPAEDAKAVADAIMQLKNISQDELIKMGQNGKMNAIKHHDYTKLAEKLVGALV